MVVAVLLPRLVGHQRLRRPERAALRGRARPPRRGGRLRGRGRADRGRRGARHRPAGALRSPTRATVEWPVVGLVVQKYGGSSVADAERDQARRRAHRRARRRPATTSSSSSRRWATPPTSCIDLAEQVSAAAAGARARHAAHRRRADLDGAARDGDRRPRLQGRVVHRLAGRRDHRRRCTARRGSSTSRRAGSRRASPRATSRSSPASRASARTPRTSPRSAAAARTPPRSRSPRRWTPTSARSTPTSTASSPPTRGSCRPPASSTRSPTRRCSRWPRAGRRSCTCAASSTPAATASRSTSARRSASSTARSWSADRRPAIRRQSWKQAIIAGVAHDRSEAKITVVGVPDKPGEAAAIFRALADAEINIDMIVQNVSAGATGRPTSRSRCRATDGPTALDGAAGAPGRDRLRVAALRRPHRQGLADRRRHALAPRRLGDVLRRARRGRRQRRDDLHLGDPDLGGRAATPTSTPRCARVHDAFELGAAEDEAVVYGGTGR